MDHGAVRQQFTAALDALVEQIKADRSVLAAILCGSLSHDTVWEKSDIDLVLVTIDDKKVETSSLSIYADGVNVHAALMPRAQFRKLVDGAIYNSFVHSLLAKGRLLYTHDETISELCGRLRAIGDRDTRLQIMSAATSALPSIYKAHKWLITRGDLDYTALWILYAATPLAQMAVLDAGLIVDREVIPQALTLNPSFFKKVYVDLLNAAKTRRTVEAALDTIDRYMADRAATVFAPLIDHLREVGEPRSCREIENYFSRHFDVDAVTAACEYLADQGIIGKVSTGARLTKKSNVDVQELAFVYVGEPPDEF